MKTSGLKRVSVRSVSLSLGVLLALVILVISALPTQTKHVLHTQGLLHPWLHLCGFGLLALLFVSSSRSDFVRATMILVLLLFGYATEANEGRRDGWGVEVRDVRSDSIGVLCGGVLGLLLSPGSKR